MYAFSVYIVFSTVFSVAYIMYLVYASNVCMHASKHLGYCDVVQEISTCAARAIQVIEAEVIAETKI